MSINKLQTEIELSECNNYLLVFKDDVDVVINKLTEEQWFFLAKIQQQLLFKDVCEEDIGRHEQRISGHKLIPGAE